MAPRLPLLLTGSTGMVGSHLYRVVLSSFRCTLIANTGRIPIGLRRGDRVVRCDLGRSGEARRLVERVEPAVVLHTAAVSSLGACVENPEATAAVNVGATRELARACAEQGAYLVFCSTDQVFDGDSAPYAEGATPRPLSAYGQQKVDAEGAVREEAEDALSLRLALVLGASPSGTVGAVDMLRPGVSSGPVGLFEDEWRTPIALGCLGRLVAALVERRPRGVLNAGGLDRVNRLELGRAIAAGFGWDGAFESRSRLAMSYPRPADVSLGLDRRRELGLPMPLPLSEAIGELTRL